MDNVSLLEEYYKKYMDNITGWLPEGIIDVDLELLQELDLLSYKEPYTKKMGLTRYFHVIETDEKITLVNEDFVVWIVPDPISELPTTYALIALNKPEHLKLEMAFATKGVYNSSNLVLRVLEKFLLEIQETEEAIAKIFRKGNSKT